ncbi:MAG: uracil phosphoribosyltransferase [Planctomycetota bacterium]
MTGVHLVDHPLVRHKLALLRSRDTSAAQFRVLVDELSVLLGYELFRDLPTESVAIETPVAPTQAEKLAGKKLVLVPILRAGAGMLSGLLRLVPSARVAHIGLYRDPQTLDAIEYYFKAPPEMNERNVFVVDPMLATGHSAIAAVQRVKDVGFQSIRMACLLAAPEGLSAFRETHPDVQVFTTAIDERLNDHGYIVPGLGDAGDRIFGTR